MNDLTNIASERAVLAGIINHGVDCYLDVEAFLEEGTFTVDFNKVIYKCITHIIHKVDKVDFVSLLSAATDLSLAEYMGKPDVLKHLQGLFATPIGVNSVTDHAKKIRKLQFARTLQESIKTSYKNLEGITGEETISGIVDVVEVPIQEASVAYLKKDDAKPKLLGEGGLEYFDFLMSDEIKQIGIPSSFPSYDAAIGGGFLRGCVDLVGARTKSLAYGSKVYTAKGPVKIEDVNVGDKILHPFGKDSIILAIYDFTNKDIYRVYFIDGDYVDCCEDHLWEVYNRYPYGLLETKSKEIKSTKDLISDTIVKVRKDTYAQYKWDIKLPNIVDYDASDVPIDPYVLGVLLGDGSLLKTCVYTSMDNELIDNVNEYFSNLGYEVKIDCDNSNNKAISYRINGFQDKLREVGVFKHNCYNKFIPKNYIYNSYKIRFAVLQGLLDTDGCCTVDKKSKRSRISFCSVSRQLAEDVKEIVTSLGGLCSIVSQVNTKLNKITGIRKSSNSFKCEIRLPNMIPFRLTRKANLVNNKKVSELKRTIARIEKVRIDNARCITISNEDGLFLTDNHVITHNCGKSVFCDNVALHVSKTLNIPVLVLDTEMSQEDHWNRVWANMSGITINDIKFGTFKTDIKKVELVKLARDTLNSIPYHYKQVYGKGFDEILSIARRWILKEVGVGPNGRTNDCLIIYDYFKLMDASSISDSMQEYQAMGFQATKLHNFAVEHDCSVLSFVQLNRDGITKESADVISQSDRIGWLCTSFSILKEKSADEIADDGHQNGNRKIVPVLSRHGPGMDDNGYICLNMVGELARITEIGTVRNLSRNRDFSERDGGFDGTESEAETED